MSMCGPAFDDAHARRVPRPAEIGEPPVAADGDLAREATVPADPESLLVEYLLDRLAALE